MNENTCHFVFASVVNKTQTFLKKKKNTKHLNYIKLVCHASSY